MRKLYETYHKLMFIFDQKQKYYMHMLIILMIIAAILETICTALMFPLMDVIVSSSDTFDSVIMNYMYQWIGSNQRTLFLIRMALIIAAIYLIKGAFAYFNNYLQQKFVANNRESLSGELFKCFMHKPYSFHLQNSTSDIQRAVITDVDWFCYYVNALMVLLSESFVVLILFAVLVMISPLITIMASILLLSSMFITSKFISKKVREAGEKNRIHSTFMLKCVQQTIGGLKGILVNCRQQYFISKYVESVKAFSKYNCIYNTIFALPRIIMETISMSGIFFIMAMLIYMKTDIDNILPVLATFAIAAVRLMPSGKRVSDSLNQMKYYFPALEKIYQTLKNKNEDDRIDKNERQINRKRELKDDIKVQHICFGFEDAERPLYENLSLSIPIHKSVAFVGQTGSGKTTLADIILGLHHPSEGDVTIDGVSIYKNREWWSQQIGYIPQNIYLCDDTIRNNIAFGYEEKNINDDKIWRSLEKAHLSEFVKRLPMGLDTITGENGIRLSGGQRQRIGIARALFSDPQILVLDEATSALDSDTEQAIMEAINQLSGEKTLIIIAHRISTISECDIVYKIENGKAIKEKG